MDAEAGHVPSTGSRVFEGLDRERPRRGPPGTRCDYSPLVNHVLMGTALVRADPKGRNFQTLLPRTCSPLGMDSTSMGCAPTSRRGNQARHARHRADPAPERHSARRFTRCSKTRLEAPHVVCASTSGDLYRFAEMLRPAAASLTACASFRPPRSNSPGRSTHGRHANELYKRVAETAGLGSAAGQPGNRLPGARAPAVPPPVRHAGEPETHGNYGAGITISGSIPRATSHSRCGSAGVMTQAANIERCQK